MFRHQDDTIVRESSRKKEFKSLTSNKIRIVNAVFFLLDDSQASEFCADVSEHCSKTSAQKTPHAGESPKRKNTTKAQKSSTLNWVLRRR